MKEWLSTSYAGNTLAAYGLAFSLWVLGSAVVWGAGRFLGDRAARWEKKTSARWDDFLVAALRRHVLPLLYLLVLMGCAGLLQWPRSVDRVLQGVVTTALAVTVFRFATQLARFILLGVWARGDSGLERKVSGILPIVTLSIWGLGIVFLLDNWGFKISAVVAALGIGGVAVALASQAVLGDLFSYIAILFDRPFEIGDFIIVGDLMGTVEYVGIKTTRLRSLSGEQLVFSNADLTSSRVRNYKRMDRRRVLFRLGVTYDTPVEKMRELPRVLERLVRAQPDVQFDRAHFAAFGDFNLALEVVYFVLSADYNRYMDVQQEINLAVQEEFARRGVSFAFPTQTLHVKGEPFRA